MLDLYQLRNTAFAFFFLIGTLESRVRSDLKEGEHVRGNRVKRVPWLQGHSRPLGSNRFFEKASAPTTQVQTPSPRASSLPRGSSPTRTLQPPRLPSNPTCPWGFPCSPAAWCPLVAQGAMRSDVRGGPGLETQHDGSGAAGSVPGRSRVLHKEGEGALECGGSSRGHSWPMAQRRSFLRKQALAWCLPAPHRPAELPLPEAG